MTTPQRNMLRGELHLSEETIEKIDKDSASEIIDGIVKIKRSYNDHEPANEKPVLIRQHLNKYARAVTKQWNPSEYICPTCKKSLLVGEGPICYC
jgi:hypothetical protein